MKALWNLPKFKVCPFAYKSRAISDFLLSKKLEMALLFYPYEKAFAPTLQLK
jgi:hypothetical protein